MVYLRFGTLGWVKTNIVRTVGLDVSIFGITTSCFKVLVVVDEELPGVSGRLSSGSGTDEGLALKIRDVFSERSELTALGSLGRCCWSYPLQLR